MEVFEEWGNNASGELEEREGSGDWERKGLGWEEESKEGPWGIGTEGESGG